MAFWQRNPSVQHRHNERWPLDTRRSQFHPTIIHTAYSLKSDSVLFSNFLQIFYIINVKEFSIPDVRKIFLFLTFLQHVNPYPTAFPYGNGMVLHFYQQQESSTTKTEHKVINKGLKTYV